MHYIYLTFAIVFEVIATSALAASRGLTRPWPIAIMTIGYALSFTCLAFSLRVIPVGVAYAIWSGAGIVLITIVGWVLFSQRIPMAGLAGIALIIVGIVIVHVAGLEKH